MNFHFKDRKLDTYDPTECRGPRRRMDTLLRRAATVWRSSLYGILVREDALSLSHASVLSWPSHERLERFASFSRDVSRRAFNVQSVGSQLLHAVYLRGYRLAYKERRASSPPDPPTSASSLYKQQLMSEVRGAVEASLQNMTREVALGVTSGDRTTKIYHRVLNVIRKVMMPRLATSGHTLITQAFNHGKLDAYEKLGVKRVGVIAESRSPLRTADARHFHDRDVAIMTAGDDLVCEICEELEGEVYTLSEARSLIPAHPNCRCTLIAYEEYEEVLAEEGTGEMDPGVREVYAEEFGEEDTKRQAKRRDTEET